MTKDFIYPWKLLGKIQSRDSQWTILLCAGNTIGNRYAWGWLVIYSIYFTCLGVSW